MSNVDKSPINGDASGRSCWMLLDVAGCCWMLKTKFISSTYPTKLVILGVRGTAVLIWGMPAAEAVPSGFGTKGGFAKMTLWHRMAQDNQKLQTTLPLGISPGLPNSKRGRKD